MAISSRKKSGAVLVSTEKSDVQSVVDKNVKGDAVIFIGESKAKSHVDFVMLFASNFDQVLKNTDLNLTDLRVLFGVLSKMCWGNQLVIKQNAIALELALDPSNVSKSWKKLMNAGVFLSDEYGNEFINFDLFLKGKGKTVCNEFEVLSRHSNDVLRDKGLNTVRPFRKIYEKTPEGKQDKEKDAVAAEKMLSTLKTKNDKSSKTPADPEADIVF